MMPIQLRRISLVSFCLAAVLGAIGCEKSPATAERGEGAEDIVVTTTRVRQQPWSEALLAVGTVKARESITVTAKVSETVDRVHFESGDEVQAGAPLVTLTGRQQQAALNAAQATANEAGQMYKRQQELASQQLVARASLDTQRATRDAAMAQVEQIRANLSDRVIRAPFAGVLGLRLVSPGALVTPGTAIATLDDIARVYVDFPVPEARLAALAPGQHVVGSSAAYPGRAFDGVVSTVEARVDAATRAVTVRADFANADRVLRPGMLVQVQLQLPEQPALVVPEIAVVQVGNDSFVYRVKADDTVERADVVIGGRNAGMVAVNKGLSAGERLVVEGTGKLRVGSKVAEAKSAATTTTPSRQD